MADVSSNDNPIYGPFFGVMGAASAIIFSGEFTNKEYLFIQFTYVPKRRDTQKNRTFCGVNAKRRST